MIRLVALVPLFACAGSETRCAPPPDPLPSPASPASRPSATPAPAPSACTTDGDCNLSNDRCVAVPGQPASPECACYEGRCAMRPAGPRISKHACDTTRDCNIELATATCGPDLPDDGLRVHWTGPTCRCNATDHRCHFEWIEPVACTTANDCWVADDRPIRRPARFKGRSFRGCVDGERVPVCRAGQCTLEALRC